MSLKILPASIKLILKPIVRLCLRHSIKLQTFLEYAKVVFIEAAEEELIKSQHEISVSKISVMTGVHRPDVVRLYMEKSPEKTEKNQISRIIGQWQHDSRFLTKAGKPKVLSALGMESEFVQLVHSVSADLNPYTILYELERTGIIERKDNSIKLASRLYLPKGDIEEGLRLLSQDTDDLICAVEENILSESKSLNLHIKTEYDNIVPEAEAEIRDWFIKQGSKFHEETREFLSKYDRDINKKLSREGGKKRVVLGTFSRVE
ncbi:MAG: hypothetical protein KBC84_00915 [Proteobacteria bacterium]|nr:hypothetical protein [Pseudomonadota bacterium]